MNAQLKLLAAATMLVALFVTSLSAQTCDENAVFQIDRIKQEIETSLISATTAEVKLASGEKLLAFYKDGSLIKISVDFYDFDGPQFSTELFFREGFVKHIAEEYSKNGKFYKDLYYFTDDKLICYKEMKSGDYMSAEKYAKAEKKWLKKVNIYLEAIQ